MVQYIHTPWRNQEELLRVRQQFYPSSAPLSTQASAKPSNAPTAAHSDDYADSTQDALALAKAAEGRQQQAVSRVSMWMQRGGCPHLVESTALLTAAVLSDLHESRTRANSSSYATRAAYSAAFSRFVTGLLDGQQDKLRKMSMYTIAKTIGLPATFVELRHQATHEQLPSLPKLRSAANNALAWIWDFYWKDLDPASKATGEINDLDSPRHLLMKYFLEQDELLKSSLRSQLMSWDEASLLQNLSEIAESSEEPGVILKALQLSRSILGGRHESQVTVKSTTSQSRNMEALEAVRVEMQALNEELDDAHTRRADEPAEMSDHAVSQSVGWTQYQGVWTPKPIGVV